jgi:hypothetical protein
MKNLRVFIILMASMVGICILPTVSYAQQNWQTRLANRVAEAVLAIQ